VWRGVDATAVVRLSDDEMEVAVDQVAAQRFWSKIDTSAAHPLPDDLSNALATIN
jgi:hypothetical protein